MPYLRGELAPSNAIRRDDNNTSRPTTSDMSSNLQCFGGPPRVHHPRYAQLDRWSQVWVAVLQSTVADLANDREMNSINVENGGKNYG
jgi:hypothetical protein